MLRTIFVLGLVAFGAKYAIQGAFGALLLYLWIAYFRPDAWVWQVEFIRTLNLSLVAGVFLVIRSLFSPDRFRFDLRSLLLLVFLTLSLLSTWVSTQSAYAWEFWIDFVKTVVVTYLFQVLVTDMTKFRTTLMVLALSLGFEGAKQGWVQLLINPGGHNDNILPMLGDNNGVAVGMLMLMAVFIALAQTSTRRWEKWLCRFFLLGVSYRAVSTYSRGGFLAAGALVMLYVLRSRRKVPAIIGALVVGTVVLSVLPPTFWDRMSTIKLSEDEIEDDSSRSRLHFWRVAVSMANANPVLGVGYNSFNRVYDSYDTLDGRYGRRRSVHSMWFGVLAELGYPAFLVYLTILGLAVLSTQSIASRSKRGDLPPEFYSYAVALQIAFATCFVGGSFVPWQYVEMLWHFIGLTMALRSIAWRTMTATAEVPSTPKPRPHTIFKPATARGV